MSYHFDPQPEHPGSDSPPRRWWWTLAGTLGAVAFVVAVTASARRDATPVGGSGPMGGMAMPGRASGARLDLTTRDVNGRLLRLPGGQPGAVLIIEARGCGACVVAARRLGRAATQIRSRMPLTAVSMEPGDTRRSLARFATQAGRPPLRYVVDDRDGMLVRMLDASAVAEVLVYDRAGRVRRADTTSVDRLRTALRRAAG